MMNPYILLLIILLLMACQHSEESFGNPAAEGFNLESSDPKAIQIADRVMDQMGGRTAWDSVETITWNFFGSRRHTWNKSKNTVHIVGVKDSFEIHMHLDSMTGSVFYDGRYLTQQDSLEKYLQKGKEMWINDSYWLVMPFKLKDSGVTLKYVDQIGFRDSTYADRLALTFDGVGVTPNNKYVVSIPNDSHLIEQWDFYADAQDSVPRFTTPWLDYQKYGNILLSSSRGENYELSEIAVTMKKD